MPYIADLKKVEKIVAENDKLIASDLKKDGKWVGESRECVAVVKYFTKVGQTTNWKKGARVKENTRIQPGTAIATFNSNGKYYGHAAIYVSQTAIAITVYDQWNDTPLHTRQIKFKGHGYVSNDGDQFYVIE
ncbi:BPSL0067 family protein [Snodgrassella alvi]|uniref:BPSL0067 family protein n=1 Tax=Snodgrassella alvi TaxID=1196083 RepID=UPI003CFE78B5